LHRFPIECSRRLLPTAILRFPEFSFHWRAVGLSGERPTPGLFKQPSHLGNRQTLGKNAILLACIHTPIEGLFFPHAWYEQRIVHIPALHYKHQQSMNKKNMLTRGNSGNSRNPIMSIVSALSAVFIFASPALQAQENTATDDDVFELSPFVVDAASETGYTATQTLAGTRIASNLKDVPAQVDVMTMEFLEDVGAVNIEDAMLYSLNAENNREYSNDPTGTDLNGVTILNGGSRVRGLGNATRTQNYFSTSFRGDTYNSTSVTMNSGPNAILYGLGSPAGIINMEFLPAYFNDKSQVKLRFDSEGSRRAQFRFNREVIDDKLAVVVAGLYSDQELWSKPSFRENKRLYAALTLKPFKKTTIRAHYEHIEDRASWPRTSTVRDGVTPYLEWREAKMDELGITDPFDPQLYWAPGMPTDNTSPFEPGGGNIILTTGKYNPIPEQFLLGSFSDGSTKTVTGGGTIRYDRPARARLPQKFAGVHPADDFGRSLDGSIFPYDINLGGGVLAKEGGNIFLASVDQQIVGDLFLNLQYHRQSWDKYHTDPTRGAGTLSIDVNRYLPQVTGSTDEPVLNPNRGRYFYQAWGQTGYGDRTTEDLRAALTYKLDFSRKEGWMSWLGTHNLTAMWDRTDQESVSANGRTLLYPNPETGLLPDGIVIDGNGSNRAHYRVNHKVYIDDPRDPSGSVFSFDPAQHTGLIVGQPYGPYDSLTVHGMLPSAGYGQWDSPRADAFQTTGKAFAIQSAFWNNRLILLYGRRTDDYLTKRVTGESIDNPYPGLWADPTTVTPTLDNPDIDNSATNETRGVVFHALNWLSVFYNESSNSAVGIPGLNILTGDLLQPTAGEGKDYGIMLELFESKLNVRINWFENSQVRNPSSFNSLKYQVGNVERKFIQWTTYDDWTGPDYNWPTGWDPESTTGDVARAQVLSDLVAEGLEFTVTYNPTKNWRMKLSAAKTESVESNIGTMWRTYIEGRESEWAKFYDRAWSGGGIAEPGEETVKDYIDSEIYAQYLDLMAASEGRTSERTSKWRVNFTTNYSFNDGWLDGWNIGGSIRWRDDRAIGFPLTTVSGSEVLDVENPWYGAGEKNIDMTIGYKTKLFNKKVNARFQLNIRNVFGDTDPISQKALTTGEVAVYKLQAPRLFVFTATFDY
jgi:iron complex outermembrane receptor protein